MEKKSKYKLPPGTWIEREMFESKAYISLKGAAPQVLILFLSKRWFEIIGRKGKNKRVCTNCDSLKFTYIEAKEKYGITKSRFSRALGELLAKGFIDVVHLGGGYQQDKSVYAIKENWRFWSPGMVIRERERETVQRGFCKPKAVKSTSKVVPLHSNKSVSKRAALK